MTADLGDGTITDVVWMVADEWRADVLGLLGTPGVHTPNLDALATRSTVFTNHWCQASPCGPARRTMLTGAETPEHGQWTNDTPVNEGPSPLSTAVRAAGLDPLLIGYTDTPTVAAPEPGQLFDPGFELVRPFFWQLGFPAYRDHLAALGLGPLEDHMMGIYPVDGEPTAAGLAPSRIPSEHSDVAWLTDAAVALLCEPRTRPMLLQLNWLRPHPPLVPPAPYHRLISPDAVAPPARGLDLEAQTGLHPFFDLVARGRPMAEYTQRPLTIEKTTETHERQARAAYYGLCAEVDHHVGRVLDAVEASGRAATTMIIFGSDHGDAFGEHWLYGRAGPFDGHFQVPCIVHDPRPGADGGRGRRIESFTTNADIAITVAEAVGSGPGHGLGGQSLQPLVDGDPSAPTRSYVRLHMDWTSGVPRDRQDRLPRPARPLRFSAVRTDRHRYVAFDQFEPLLFDLGEDPAETTNRAADPGQAAIVDELRSLLAPGRV